jgi:hypothetical protein
LNTKKIVTGAIKELLIKKQNKFYECSSIGRAAVSKTAGWGFESLHSCYLISLNLL